MLVPSMTLQEIKNALIADYSRELKMKLTGIYVCAQGKWMRNGRKAFTETISYVTRSKNHWRITVQMNSTGGFFITPYLIVYDHVGIKAFQFTNPLASDALLYFNTHFFKRYRERRKINIEKPEEVVKHFFKHNECLIPLHYKKEDGTHQLFCPFDNGLGLGYYLPDIGVFEFKTYVDDDLLRQEQWAGILHVYNQAIERLNSAKRNNQKNSNAQQNSSAA